MIILTSENDSRRTWISFTRIAIYEGGMVKRDEFVFSTLSNVVFQSSCWNGYNINIIFNNAPSAENLDNFPSPHYTLTF
jgi:hypothetical protein